MNVVCLIISMINIPIYFLKIIFSIMTHFFPQFSSLVMNCIVSTNCRALTGKHPVSDSFFYVFVCMNMYSFSWIYLNFTYLINFNLINLLNHTWKYLLSFSAQDSNRLQIRTSYWSPNIWRQEETFRRRKYYSRI